MYLLFMSAQALFTDGQKKNTPPEVPSNDKGHRNKLNGTISVDANTCLRNVSSSGKGVGIVNPSLKLLCRNLKSYWCASEVISTSKLF